jgi:hypothetical protein
MNRATYWLTRFSKLRVDRTPGDPAPTNHFCCLPCATYWRRQVSPTTFYLIAGSIVDAAHIHEFRDSRNNDPRNGIALSKNAHWTFDQGLWTIADDYRIVVAVGQLAEAEPNEDNLLASYHGRRLNLPEDRVLWPDPIHLAWHRKARFKAA